MKGTGAVSTRPILAPVEDGAPVRALQADEQSGQNDCHHEENPRHVGPGGGLHEPPLPNVRGALCFCGAGSGGVAALT